MSLTKATIRVRGLSGLPNERPERARLEQAAQVLADEGFDVIRVGRFGVSVSSEDDNFERVLGVEPRAALVAPVQPKRPELKDLVDLIQVDNEPQFYSKAEPI
jgi:hypothetical protein